MTDEVSKQLDAVNSEMARRLSECEEQLKGIITEYRAWSQTGLFAVLDQSAKAQVENSVRAYLDSNGKRLQAARAGLEALRGLGAAVHVGADPLGGLVPPSLAPAVPQTPAIRLGMPEELPDAPAVTDDGEDFIPVEAPASPPSAQAGSDRGRPRSRESQGSAAPVDAAGPGFKRSAAGGTAGAGGQRRMAAASGERRIPGAATVRSMSESEIETGERPSGVSIGEADSGNESDLVTGRSMAPDSDYEAAMRHTKEKQRKAIAAKSAESDDIMAAEAEILDDTEKLIGRATGVRRHGKQVMVDQIELFLESMPPFSSDDPESMVREIVKARKMWRFHGSNKSFSAMVAHANRKGFDENDSGVLLMEDVGLAGGVRQEQGA